MILKLQQTMKYTGLFVIILLLVLTMKSHAQNEKTLQQCIEIAMQNNLTMQSGKIAIEQARALQATAFNIDRTSITLSQDPSSGGSPDNSLSLGQSFDFPTIYFSKHNLLKAQTDLERKNLEITQNELVMQISSLYYQILYARETINILHEQDSIYEKFVFLATAKFNSGETSRLEKMNAERTRDENKIELQKAKNNYQTLQLMLQRYMNAEESVNPAERTLSVMHAVSVFSDFKPNQTPLMQFFETKKAISETALNLEKQGFLPRFNISVRNQFLISGFNPYNIQRESFNKGNFMGFEVGISLPLFFGEQRAKTKIARREIEKVNIQQEEALMTLKSEYQIAINEYLKAKNTLDYYQIQGIANAYEISLMSQISYEKGEIGYVEYIQNMKTAVELYLQYATAINDYNQTIIKLNYLKGNK